MNCEKCQRRLLACERPEEPAGELLGHLASCSACRDYQQQILQLERALGGVRVPSSAAAKERTLKLILTEPLVRHPLLPDQHHGGQLKDRGLRKMAVAFALAASLLIFALGSWVLKNDQPAVVTGPKPSAADRLDPRLTAIMDKTSTPRQRVKALAELTETLQDEGQVLAEADDMPELKRLVRFHQDVVDHWLVKQARALSPDERQEVLEPIMSRLLRSVQALRENANGLGSPEAKQQLEIMADVTREGDRRLRELLHEG
jgi:hypothetical protein